ncbi:hypothetical protein DAI22_02g311900 [Oryza sativa Japonica Group]|nr:hypothetical protein DAI22_02g311900 [Oryza sativa Japonica Group]
MLWRAPCHFCSFLRRRSCLAAGAWTPSPTAPSLYLSLSLSLSLTPPHISSFLLLHANRRFIEELLAFAMAAFLLRSISQNGDDEQQLLVVVVTPDTAMRRRSRD